MTQTAKFANPPRRHHFIPQMILRNFADTDGDLWFWRRDFRIDDVRKTPTKNLFVRNDLYTQVNSQGEKDVALEHFFADLEGIGAEFIRQLARIVRDGNVPKLDEGTWNFWHRFFIISSNGHRITLSRSRTTAISRQGQHHSGGPESDRTCRR